MFAISSQSDYGLIIVSSLFKKKGFVPLVELVKDTKLPLRFLARIAATLAKNNILESREGREGGYKLAKKLSEISLYDFLKIFDDDIELCKCCGEGYKCEYKRICHHGSFLHNKLSKILNNNLKEIKLSEVFS